MNVKNVDNSRRRAPRLAIAAATVLAGLGWCAAPAIAQEQPNVMIITSDDQRDDQMKVMTRTRRAFDDAGRSSPMVT